MDLESFKERYFRSLDNEDLPSDNTFDKYQIPYFSEKEYDVDVRDGQLNIDFEGENWACCVSAIVVYPDAKAAEGRRFLDFVKARRRFHFDNAFKRVLPRPTGEAPKPTGAERERGFVAFHRDCMKDVNVNDRPLPGELRHGTDRRGLRRGVRAGDGVAAAAARPGQASLTVTDLRGPPRRSLPRRSMSATSSIGSRA